MFNNICIALKKNKIKCNCWIYFEMTDLSFCQTFDCNVCSLINNVTELIKIGWSALTFFDGTEWNSQILISISHWTIPSRIRELRTSWILATYSVWLCANFKQLTFCSLEAIIKSSFNTMPTFQAWLECNCGILSFRTSIFLGPCILYAQNNQY